MEIHQLSSGFGYGDAISNHALGLRQLLRSWGYPSEICARWIEGRVARECRSIRTFQWTPDAILIYHYSIGADEVTRRFLEHPGPRALIYHNITPHHFFTRYSMAQYHRTRRGREELGAFADKVQMALGDSAYNCEELAQRGFVKPRVLPLLIDFERMALSTPSPAILNRYADDWINFLFVGRVAPNKCQEDVIRAFACYNRTIQRRSRLFLIGHTLGMENYFAELREVARSCGVSDHVFFTGQVDNEELAAYYRLADVFLCLSEHEGFCVPLLEALHYEVPVLAYAATAVPETLGEAGVLIMQKDWPAIAEMVHLLTTDSILREQIVRRQKQRLGAFRPESIAEQFRTYISELAGRKSA
jgi:glycosyltransferase involved in cell wall biosynthesis